MNNLKYLSSEYAIVDGEGNVHFEEEGDKLCLINTKVMMIKQGNIIFDGTDEELQLVADPYIHRFIKGR